MDRRHFLKNIFLGLGAAAAVVALPKTSEAAPLSAGPVQPDFPAEGAVETQRRGRRIGRRRVIVRRRRVIIRRRARACVVRRNRFGRLVRVCR